MPFHVIDGNNQFRIEFETRGSIRAVLYELNTYPPFEPILWVWDGYNAKARRRAKYPGYKVGRQSASDEFYKTMDLFKQVLPYTRCMSLEIPEWEADDVIAKLHKLYAPTTDSFRIRSTDGDMLALCDGVKTQLVGRDNVKYENTDWNEVRLMKTLVGDASDKISGIPGFGPKAWEFCDRERWLQFFTEGYKPCWDSESGSFNLGKKPLAWVKENEELLKGMWDIIGFYDVPDELISKHLVVGKQNDVEMNKILKDFLI
jgi:hypothetical protein